MNVVILLHGFTPIDSLIAKNVRNNMYINGFYNNKIKIDAR